MKDNTLREFHYFMLPDYEKEEAQCKQSQAHPSLTLGIGRHELTDQILISESSYPLLPQLQHKCKDKEEERNQKKQE